MSRFRYSVKEIQYLAGKNGQKTASFWQETGKKHLKDTERLDEYFMTHESIALEMRVTKERVRQIILKAIRKLQHQKRSKNLKEFLET